LTEFEYESLFGETFGILELYLEQGATKSVIKTPTAGNMRKIPARGRRDTRLP